jgi:tetratricopeptide (TPR) repeat protein
MTRRILTGALALAAGINCLTAQPKPKSQKEVEAILAVQNAKAPDARIEAVDNLITKFADTEFKDWALYQAAEAAQIKGDFEKMKIYAERDLEANPKNFQAMLLIAEYSIHRTGEHDLDRDAKIAEGEKWAKQAVEALKTAPKPRPDLTDEQWTKARNQISGQAHQTLGLLAMMRKKYDVAETEFKAAYELLPEAAFQVRLAQAYIAGGKLDEAIATAQKVMDTPNVHPQVKQVAQALRAAAMQAKGAAKPAAAPAPKPAPGQVEIKN